MRIGSLRPLVPTMVVMVDTVVLAAPRGFCAGVEMAIKALTWMVRVFPAPVYCYHEIVHNASVVEAFERAGVVFVESIAEVPAGAPVMLSAHGSAPEVVAAALDPPAEISNVVAAGGYDWVMANPPYLPLGRGNPPPDRAKRTAHVEGSADLNDWVRAGHKCLKRKGTLAIILRADRLSELLAALGAIVSHRTTDIAKAKGIALTALKELEQ